MKIHVQEHDLGLKIRIDDPAGREYGVLKALCECRKNSAWACPSGECVNIATINVEPADQVVLLDLAPRSGAKLSGSAIQECLRYLLDKPVKS